MFTDRDNRPIFPFGGECMNSTTVNLEDRQLFWKSLELLRANAAEVPVYWETVEPEEGRFDFSIVDTLLAEARERGLHLILLWFGTWKNGMMKYCPAWIKNQPDRFLRFRAHDGALVTNLSPSCEANLAADRNAFCRLMAHLKAHDAEKTVIGVQIENEPGTFGRVVRDYQGASIALFEADVPEVIMRGLKGGAGAMAGAWASAGKPEGSWRAVFGGMADEYFASWQVAAYINEIARAGKSVYNLPFFVNAWMDNVGFDMPGIDYPAGGPVTKVLDLWKWATPDIDMVCPDIYIRNKSLYDAACAAYTRPDNPLFVPESDCRRGYENEVNMFSAIGTFGAVGYFAFGTEHLLHPDGTPNESFVGFVGSFHALRAICPLLEKYRGTGRIHTVRQAEYTSEGFMRIGKYAIRIVYGYDRTDLRHNLIKSREPARGLIVQADEDEFFFAGAGFTALMIPRHTGVPYESRVLERAINYEYVEEGYFGEDGGWVRTKIRTGDESDSGIWVYPDVGCVRVKLCE